MSRAAITPKFTILLHSGKFYTKSVAIGLKISRVDFQRDLTTSSGVIDYTPFFIKTCCVLHEVSREQAYGKSSRYLAQTTRLYTGILENPQEKCLCECFLDSVPIISRLDVDAIFRPPYWRTRLYNFARNISTNILTLAQHIHIKLGKLFSLFIQRP